MFQIAHLSWYEWLMVLKISVPVILIDETLKSAARYHSTPHTHRSIEQLLSPFAIVAVAWAIFIAFVRYF